MVIPAAIGTLLILFGLVLFIVDLNVTNHGLPTAGGIAALLAGGLALLWAGVPYSGVLLGAFGVVAVLMGGVLLGCWVLRAPSEGDQPLLVRRG